MNNTRLIKSSSLSKHPNYDNYIGSSINSVASKNHQSFMNSFPIVTEINFGSSDHHFNIIKPLHKQQPIAFGHYNNFFFNNQQPSRLSIDKNTQKISSSVVDQQDKAMHNGIFLNRSDKIGSKIKNKAEMPRSNNHIANGSQIIYKTEKSKDNLLGMKQQTMNYQANLQWLVTEVSSIGTRISKFEQKLERLESCYKKSQDVNQKLYQSHIGQINKIFNVIEKAQNRNDSLHMNKMIQEMRQNILDIQLQISNLQNQQQNIKIHKESHLHIDKSVPLINEDNDMMKRIKKLQDWQNIHFEDFLNKKMQIQIAKQSQVMQLKIKELRRQFENNEFKIVKSGRRFEGRMINLLYEQKLISNEQNKNVVIFSKKYYLDVDGFLLDQNCNYLLNNRGQSIQLHQSQIELLRKHRLL